MVPKSEASGLHVPRPLAGPNGIGIVAGHEGEEIHPVAHERHVARIPESVRIEELPRNPFLRNKPFVRFRMDEEVEKIKELPQRVRRGKILQQLLGGDLRIRRRDGRVVQARGEVRPPGKRRIQRGLLTAYTVDGDPVKITGEDRLQGRPVVDPGKSPDVPAPWMAGGIDPRTQRRILEHLEVGPVGGVHHRPHVSFRRLPDFQVMPNTVMDALAACRA